MKKRIILGISLIFLLLVTLTGCGKAPQVVALFVSEPDTVVGATYNPAGMKVYRLYDDGNVKEAVAGEYSTEIGTSTASSLVKAGVREITIIDRENKDPNNKNEYLKTSFKVIITDEAIESLDARDSFLSFKYIVTTDEKGKTISPFTHNIGYNFDYENFQDLVKIRLVTNEDGETVFSDVTNQATILADEEELTTVRYKEEKYQVKFSVLLPGDDNDTITGVINVMAMGGEKPIHKESANWFDYILVIPVGWILQLFAFGGNFAIGILFATIIIRSLAWPIYAKTNMMSANMAEAQPDLNRIQAKYRGRTDKASQQAMQMETMQIYKKYKIGIGSMFLPFLQMPIFIAMYQTVRRILIPGGYWAEKVSGTTFLGIDLTIGNHWTSYILAAVVGVTMLLLQWLPTRKGKGEKKTIEHNKNPQANQQAKTMKIVSYVMVAMMVIFSLQNNALALYWVFGNAYSIAQHFIQKAITKKIKMKKDKETLGGIL